MPTDYSCQTDEPFWVIGIYKMEKQIEIFKDIPGYEGMYQVSNLGCVKSLERKGKTKGRILKQRKRNGYFRVNFSVKQVHKTFQVHQLVAMAFLNHNPCGFELVVDHINNIKTDNRLENLQLISVRENTSKDKKGGTSKYIGVTFHKLTNKWQSCIYINGKYKHLGLFINEKDAHLTYQKALKQTK